jgi:uncharacterized membrane protein (DUF4010 family)
MADLILVKLLIAGAAGFIIGTERGWSARELDDWQRLAGMRTFTLAGLAGGVCTLLPQGNLLLAVLLGGIALLLAGTRLIGPNDHAPGGNGHRDIGLTTELALLVTPLLGALATDHPLEATAAAALTAGLLGFKQELHGVVERLDRQELLASLQLLIVAVVILPLLPDTDLGPWASLNPRTIGWLVLLLLGLSYVGYFAVRLIGPGRGLLLTALLGGFTSSTAVTLQYSRLSRGNPDAAPLLSAGIALACAMLAPRVAIIVGAIQPGLLPALAAPLAAFGLVPLGFALWAARQSAARPPVHGVHIANPFALRAALTMAAAITVLSVAIRGAEALLGDAGTYAVAALSGILDVDAVSVSLASRPGSLGTAVAANGILVAVAVNTGAKAVMAAVAGTWALARRVGLALLLATLAAGLTLLAR